MSGFVLPNLNNNAASKKDDDNKPKALAWLNVSVIGANDQTRRVGKSGIPLTGATAAEKAILTFLEKGGNQSDLRFAIEITAASNPDEEFDLGL